MGIRIVMENDVTQWKAIELDADDPDGNNRFIVQHTGQDDPVMGERSVALATSSYSSVRALYTEQEVATS